MLSFAVEHHLSYLLSPVKDSLLSIQSLFQLYGDNVHALINSNFISWNINFEINFDTHLIYNNVYYNRNREMHARLKYS